MCLLSIRMFHSSSRFESDHVYCKSHLEKGDQRLDKITPGKGGDKHAKGTKSLARRCDLGVLAQRPEAVGWWLTLVNEIFSDCIVLYKDCMQKTLKLAKEQYKIIKGGKAGKELQELMLGSRGNLLKQL